MTISKCLAFGLIVAASSSNPSMLQNNRSSQPGLNTDFFTETPEKIESMPAYAPKQRFLGHPANSPVCDPQCKWDCGPKKECDQTCEPVCAPPECTTLCGQNDDRCEIRCSKPQCAVVCPVSSQCVHGDCGRCRTVCGPPQCTTQCKDQCESHCAKPKCTWKCKANECPKPKCKMNCTGLTKCNTQFTHLGELKPPSIGMKVMSSGEAHLDPATLFPAVKAPAPWSMDAGKAPPGLQPLKTDHGIGPVAQLKRVWKEQDVHKAMKQRDEKWQHQVAETYAGGA